MTTRLLRGWVLGLSLFAAVAGGVALAPRAAEAQAIAPKQVSNLPIVANALVQFETATRWESLRPQWRARRNAWIAQVRAATTPQQLAALALELETIMTWEAMAPRWRQERPVWVARCRAAASDHDVAQLLIQLETATTWAAMFENRWRPARAGWLASLRRV